MYEETESMVGMKPCPFCGDTFIHARRTNDGWQIGCNTCNCFGCMSFARVYQTGDDAIKAWNKRDDDKIQLLEEEVDFLKSMQLQMVQGMDDATIGSMVAQSLGLRR